MIAILLRDEIVRLYEGRMTEVISDSRSPHPSITFGIREDVQ